MDWLIPDWPAPPYIHTATTLRTGGVSQAPYQSWNLAAHVGDDPGAVGANRALLEQRLELPGEPHWLNQTHGSRIIEVGPVEGESGHDDNHQPPTADASFTCFPGTICAVLTADCLPILLTDGQTVAAVHGGWRGLLNGILDNALTEPPWQTLPIAWLGPAIGPESFEVGPEVRRAFRNRDPSFSDAFHPKGDRFLADLYQIARLILVRHGVTAIYGGKMCTYNDSDRFFSYRREGVCGRMATLIWRAG